MTLSLRHEVLRIPTDDGGLDLFDLLYDRIEHLSKEEVRGLERGDPTLFERLDALALLEGPQAETLRAQRYARHVSEVRRHRVARIEEVDWSRATSWPDIVSEHWRTPEHLRRLAESRQAGNVFLALPGFLTQAAAAALSNEIVGLPFERMDTPWVRGARHRLEGGAALSAWTTLLTSITTRALFGGILGRTLDAHLTANVWRLETDDRMPVHPDGRRYQGTLSLGLSKGWSASQGGAIAIGHPTERGFEVTRRWLPHQGDVLLFAPAVDTWHAVEPVIDGVRTSVTSWWTGP
ncbi:MAG: 2OG-Fe(II) oxygenase [Myxococcota bacterium]